MRHSVTFFCHTTTNRRLLLVSFALDEDKGRGSFCLIKYHAPIVDRIGMSFHLLPTARPPAPFIWIVKQLINRTKEFGPLFLLLFLSQHRLKWSAKPQVFFFLYQLVSFDEILDDLASPPRRAWLGLSSSSSSFFCRRLFTRGTSRIASLKPIRLEVKGGGGRQTISNRVRYHYIIGLWGVVG